MCHIACVIVRSACMQLHIYIPCVSMCATYACNHLMCAEIAHTGHNAAFSSSSYRRRWISRTVLCRNWASADLFVFPLFVFPTALHFTLLDCTRFMQFMCFVEAQLSLCFQYFLKILLLRPEELSFTKTALFPACRLTFTPFFDPSPQELGREYSIVQMGIFSKKLKKLKSWEDKLEKAGDPDATASNRASAAAAAETEEGGGGDRKRKLGTNADGHLPQYLKKMKLADILQAA